MEELEPDLTLEAFAERVAALVRARHADAEVSFVPGDALSLRIAWPGGRWHRANLENMWRDYKLSRGQESARAVEDYLKTIDAPDAPAPGADALVVMIRNASLLEATRQAGGEVVTWPFVADMVAVLAFDLPESIQLAAPADLARLGLDRDAARARGTQNLLARLEVERHGDETLHMLTAGGHYEASLLLNTALWTSLAPTVQGSIVAGVPCRDIVYYTGEQAPGGVDRLARATEHMVKVGSHVVSRTLLRFAGDDWVVYEPG